MKEDKRVHAEAEKEEKERRERERHRQKERIAKVERALSKGPESCV